VMCTGRRDCTCDVHWIQFHDQIIECSEGDMRNKARISECSGNCIRTACFKHTKSPNFAHTMYSYVSYNRQSKLIISLHSRKWFVVIQTRKWLVVRPVCYLCSLN